MNLARQLAESLRKLRHEADMTQKDMAKRLGLSHATLHRLERGDYNTTLRVLEDLCEVFNCGLSDLFEPERLKLPSSRVRRRR